MSKSVIDNRYSKFLENIKEYFKNSETSIHKARNEIKIIDFEDEKLVVKSFKIPHFLNKIVYGFFRDSKAKKSYENSLKIGEFAPKAIGYIEFKKCFLLERSFFVSENFKYDLTIREPLLEKNYPDKNKIFDAFARFTFHLHNNGIFHQDYSPGNILIKKEEDRYIFKIVDINRMKFKNLSLDEKIKNFSKLWAKNEDLIIILKAYSKYGNLDEDKIIKKGLFFSQKHKDKKNFKKKLRGEKVND
ncbi:hypothetical protein [Halarcobacter sp.]|uniref:hypothetical protein n=1 Tax=Halarcobacter sp. TaxID=2321133 RepID=UPI002AA5FB80|nr:hypothetical protein [Halarcobacter sp.]